MAIYQIEIPEVWYHRYRIEADNKDEAIRSVLANGDPVDESGGDYSHNLEPEDCSWYIIKLPEEDTDEIEECDRYDGPDAGWFGDKTDD